MYPSKSSRNNFPSIIYWHQSILFILEMSSYVHLVILTGLFPPPELTPLLLSPPGSWSALASQCLGHKILSWTSQNIFLTTCVVTVCHIMYGKLVVGRHVITWICWPAKSINTIKIGHINQIKTFRPWNKSSEVSSVQSIHNLHIVSITASSLSAVDVKGLPPWH